MCAFAVRDERDNAAISKAAVGSSIDEGLEVRAEARGHDGDSAWRLCLVCHF